MTKNQSATQAAPIAPANVPSSPVERVDRGMPFPPQSQEERRRPGGRRRGTAGAQAPDAATRGPLVQWGGRPAGARALLAGCRHFARSSLLPLPLGATSQDERRDEPHQRHAQEA